MEEFKGTPGPWVNVGGWVDAEKRRGDLSGIVCSISAVAARNPDEINDANADLIAAAPDLLEALQGLFIATLYGVRNSSAMNSALEKSQDAINKALGK